MGAYERAAEFTKRARAIAALSKDSRGQRETAILMADIALSQGRGDVTQEMCELARELDERDGATALVVHDDIGIASGLARQGMMESARRAFHAALPQAAATGQDHLVTASLFGIAHTWESENVDSAAHYYERSLERLEERRASAGGAGVRTGFLSGERRFYYEEVARFYSGCDPDGAGEWAARAFTTIERAKARGLLDLVDNALRRTPSPAEEAILDELYGLDASPGTEDEKNKQRGQLEAEYIRLREARAGHAYDRARDTGRIAAVTDVQSRLPENTAMVAYALGDTSSLVWAITPSRHQVYEIADRRTIAAAVDRLRDAIARPGAGDATLRTAGHALWLELLAPVGDIIDGATSIVIVPDGKLFELPFEALIAEPADDGANWGDLAFVARRFEAMVVAPSASVWLELARLTPGEYAHELVAFGDPDYGRLQPKPGRGGALEALPYTREEVLTVSAGVSDARKAVYLGASANESALKREMGRGARILHLATHGLVDPVDPAASSVALCPDDATGDDGYLHTLEILSATVEAGLVVLSACESARGRIGRGEGVVGLSRAFIAAGARGVVASLWPVSDKSTAALMAEFYKGMLKDKQPATVAMRRARLALLNREEFSHPFHWAPFVVVGTSAAPW
jgi:CHAT domain-containing protein